MIRDYANRQYKNNDDFIELFEERLCEYTGAPFAVAVDSCTHAIFLSLHVQRLTGTGFWTITLPTNTYLSVPMTLRNMHFKIDFRHDLWEGHYQIGKTKVYDYAVGFEKDMYVPDTYQCLSFQDKKRLPIGKGGAILLDNPDHAYILQKLRHDGRDSSRSVAQDLDNIKYSGFHMNMTPEQAVKGVMLMNQMSETYTNGSFKDYPSIHEHEVFK